MPGRCRRETDRDQKAATAWRVIITKRARWRI
jgi:hypothetical protein